MQLLGQRGGEGKMWLTTDLTPVPAALHEGLCSPSPLPPGPLLLVEICQAGG
jgi:hypothetical protein